MKLDTLILKFMMDVCVTIIGLYLFYVSVGIPEMRSYFTKKIKSSNFSKLDTVKLLTKKDEKSNLFQERLFQERIFEPEAKPDYNRVKWLIIPLVLLPTAFYFRPKNFVIDTIRTSAAVLLGEFIFFEFFLNKVIIFNKEDLRKSLTSTQRERLLERREAAF